jgi:uncharacterized OB-fold protein
MPLSVDRFYELASQGKLMGLKCSRGHTTVPPRRSCGECNSLELDTLELSGKARIISFTSVFVKSKDFPVETPYVLALVSLLEGGHLLGVVNAAESDIKYGAEVSVKFKKIQETDKWPRIFFEVTS